MAVGVQIQGVEIVQPGEPRIPPEEVHLVPVHHGTVVLPPDRRLPLHLDRYVYTVEYSTVVTCFLIDWPDRVRFGAF